MGAPTSKVVRCALALGPLLLLACSSGEPRAQLGGQCDLNSDCDAPLVCRLDYCRAECATSRDCAVGLACVLDGEGLGACQLPAERSCALQTDCPSPLVCRASQCVNECAEEGAFRDCPAGAVCQSVEGGLGCIEQVEVACVYDGDCPPAADGTTRERCIEGRCREQCLFDRDCRRGYACLPRARGPRMCVPGVDGGGVGDGGGADVGGADGGGADGGGVDGGGAGDGGGADGGTPGCGVGPLTGVRDISVGGGFACAIGGAGAAAEVLCWGRFGDIGDPGGRTAAPCPVAVPGLAGLDVVQLDVGGSHACAVLRTGEVYCWGWNGSGELGRGTVTLVDEPLAQVPGITATGVTTGWTNTCIWRTGMDAMCWGGNDWGELGIGPCRACSFFLSGAAGADRPSPVTVTVVSGPQDLSVNSGGHTCGIVSGVVECWGKSGEGQLGMAGGTMIDDAVDVTAGNRHSCAIRGGDGSVHCWGDNFNGSLGDGTTTSRETIAPVLGLPGPAVQIDGEAQTCAVLAAGSVYCWGNATDGKVAPGMDMTTQPVPQLVIPSGATKVEVGSRFTCAQVGDEVRCWGHNGFGQLGVGTTTPVTTVATVLQPAP